MKILVCLCCLYMAPCSAQLPPRYGVLITELLPDPSPAVGLPESEFVEITNTTRFSVILSRWKLTDGQSVALIPDGTILEPDSSLILCSRNNQAAYARFGNCIGLSGFPSLDNAGDQLQLITSSGMLMHAVSYNTDSYENTLKASGGWSLEMADIRWPCLQQQNWRASIHPEGGTPGKRNSLAAITPDTIGPRPFRTYSPDSMTIVVVFNETVDSLSAGMPARYELDQGIGMPVSAQPAPPFFNEVRLRLAGPMKPKQVYTLRVSGISNCSGNTMTTPTLLKAALSLPPVAASVRINELLFNPPANGSDYLELYNHSDHTINLEEIFIGNRNSTGQPGSFIKSSAQPWNLYPDEFIVLTEDTGWVRRHYTGTNMAALIQRSPMPSWPDNGGIVIVSDRQGNILDEFTYDNHLHFPLLGSQEGVSLERISPVIPSSEKSNWHSASTASGYGTPTQTNTQHRDEVGNSQELRLEPSVFSPDLDGYNDFVMIGYRFDKPGTVCNVSIFDAGGSLVRMLVQNQLCGIIGSFRWDGLDQRTMPLSPGVYHIFIDLFHVNGFRKKIRYSVAMVYSR